MSNRITPRKGKVLARENFKVIGDHEEFLSRINKTLYYGKLPTTERFSLPVSELAAELFSEEKYGRSLDRLRLEEAASMSRNACVSPCSLVLALVYLERLKVSNVEYVRQVPPSELFLVTMMVASKFLYDDGEEDEVFNDEWAASAGIDVKEMNRFERDFLQAINWEVFVSEQNFWKRLWCLEKQIALQEGKRRGWFSYTDMERLLESVDITALVNAVLTVSAVCITSYTVSVLALLGSAFIVSQIPGNAISRNTQDVSQSAAEIPQNFTANSEQENADAVVTNFILASLGSSDRDNTAVSVDFNHNIVSEIAMKLSEQSTETVEGNGTGCPAVINSYNFDDEISWKLVKSLVDWFWHHSWLQNNNQRGHTYFDLKTAPGNYSYSSLHWITFIAPWSLKVPYHMAEMSPGEVISLFQ
ncbi:protein CNPPD1 [Schistocerca nitens]|uniref:protein CNPPD1 n=1 Tax=Schistocerca nitens TaxID=7011 RepID=UPI002117CD83|nr:protein CNPPD1 [Schistocerca nitens]